MHGIAIALIVIASAGGVACGGRPPPPKPPPPLDAKKLAELIYGDFTLLGEMAQRLRGKCPELTAELRPHVTRMKQRKADVDEMVRDAKQATELKAELANYANPIKGLSDKIAADLATTYRACPAPPATDRYQLERVIADMPTY